MIEALRAGNKTSAAWDDFCAANEIEDWLLAATGVQAAVQHRTPVAASMSCGVEDVSGAGVQECGELVLLDGRSGAELVDNQCDLSEVLDGLHFHECIH